MKFLCEQCKAKYQIADEKAVGKTVRMKCRKCGHLIEVRAAVTETSVSSPVPVPMPVSSPSGATPPHEGQAPAPAPPVAAPLAASFASGAAAVKVAPRPERPQGALEGAFKTAVQNEAAAATAATAAAAAPQRPPPRDEEHSTPFDMSDLSPSDEWYVAINGVPVGPIRVAEVRRKAALGAVTEDSLVWQEGLDEWRPLRSFPELAASVREAMTRLSRPPAAEMRLSAPPPPPSRTARPAPSSSGSAPAGSVPRAAPPRAPSTSTSATASASSVAPHARSNVVPIMSRLATAEKLEPTVRQRTSPVPGPPAAPPQPVAPSVVPDPFALPAPSQAAPVSVPALAATSAMAMPAAISIAAPAAPRQVHWIPLAMVAMAIAFGVTAAIAFVFRPTPAAPAPVAEPSTPAPPATVTAAAAATALAVNDPVERAPVTPSPSAARGPAAAPRATAVATSTAAAPTAAGRSLDLHALTQNGPGIAPTEDPAGDAPKAAGQSLSESQVQQVVGLHRTAITRGCWERNPTTKLAVNVNVTLTVAPDGSAQNVAAAGDDPSVAKCIENDVRGWRFPASGSSQKMAIPFKFVRQ